MKLLKILVKVVSFRATYDAAFKNLYFRLMPDNERPHIVKKIRKLGRHWVLECPTRNADIKAIAHVKDRIVWTKKETPPTNLEELEVVVTTE